jgi:hypothetical protein
MRNRHEGTNQPAHHGPRDTGEQKAFKTGMHRGKPNSSSSTATPPGPAEPPTSLQAVQTAEAARGMRQGGGPAPKPMRPAHQPHGKDHHGR